MVTSAQGHALQQIALRILGNHLKRFTSNLLAEKCRTVSRTSQEFVKNAHQICQRRSESMFNVTKATLKPEKSSLCGMIHYPDPFRSLIVINFVVSVAQKEAQEKLITALITLIFIAEFCNKFS